LQITDVCDSSPCYNGGTCKVDEWGQATCECFDGYSGRFCDESKNKNVNVGCHWKE
jgi:Notch-like protein